MKPIRTASFFGAPLVALAALVALLSFGSTAAESKARSAAVPGQKAFAFRTRTVDGKLVTFPADYKGKVVLLDFWATWCPPCRAELPKIVEAYKTYHDKGFEVLSVSLDQPKKGPALLQFVKENNMTWPQIYDGGYWKAAIAIQYGVRSIPCPVLVDGDTGMILATEGGALGANLPKSIEKALSAKGKK